MLLLSLCLKDSTDGEFLVSSGRLFQIRVIEGRNELWYCWDLQGLSGGSSRYASYIDLYYQQLMVQVRRGIQVPKNGSSYRRGRVCAFLFSM